MGYLKLKIADVTFAVKPIYKYFAYVSRDYLVEDKEPVAFTIETTLKDIESEKQQSNGYNYPDYYLESLAIYRKLCEHLLNDYQGIIFHSSAIMVDGYAYLFTAPSGTGKSTHARLWRELLGERAVMVNDDKPIIRYIDGKFIVYGTPWTGKHNLGNNCSAEVKGICEIYQAKENVIKKASANEMLVTLLNQTLRPEETDKLDKLLNLIGKMLSTVGLYKLGCNMELDAAKLSYATMTGKE